MIHRIIYTSEARETLTDAELRSIAMFSALSNKANNISGLLLHHNKKIMQVLEGETTVIKALYAKIEKDKRHKNVTLHIDDSYETKIFQDWSMGYRPLETSAEMDMFFALTRSTLKAATPDSTPPEIKKTIEKFAKDNNL